MKQCAFCKTEKHEDDFYMYSSHKMTRDRIQKGYVCKPCSDRMYGDKWCSITGYDEQYEISNNQYVRELRENKYFNITHVQNAGVQYVRLNKNGKTMKKNTMSLMKRFYKEV